MKIEQLLRLMVDKCASDLHLMVGSQPVMRVCGILANLEDYPILATHDLESAMQQLTTENQRGIFNKEHELDFAYGVHGLARFRVSVIQQRGTPSIAVRLVPYRIPTIDELELPEICKDLILKPRGLILVTGAAGTGKSTTLAAMINHLNETERRNIITIEDPIEYTFSNKKCLIRQRDLGDDASSFPTALVHALRHDPDVIVIGEMRDLQTISTAVRAAETGHLVLGTLHTIDAPQSIDRMIDVFPYGQQRQIRLQLSQVVEAVLSQRLLARVGGGRVAAFEIMLGTNSVQKLVREEKLFEITAHIETCSREGMQSMDQALAILVRRGTVTFEEALSKSTNPEKLKAMVMPAETRRVLNYS